MAEMLLCSCHCLPSGDIQFQFVPTLKMIILTTWVKCFRVYSILFELQHPVLGFCCHSPHSCTNPSSTHLSSDFLCQTTMAIPSPAPPVPCLFPTHLPPTQVLTLLSLPYSFSPNGYYIGF